MKRAASLISLFVRVHFVALLFVLHAQTAVGETIPSAQAAHFCRLLLYDGETIMPMSVHARKLMSATDSLTAEQLFTSYVFYRDNWQALRIFPHAAADGTVAWYSPADSPASLDSEHQKYIHEVMPRLRQEILAGNWQTVDAYIDRMIQYQCRFGSEPPRDNVLWSSKSKKMYFLLVVFILICTFAAKLRKYNERKARTDRI